MGDMGDHWRDVKAEKKRHTKTVERADQSPMNPKRWCLTLVCGHEVWVTRSVRPKLQQHFCERCAQSQKREGG